MIDFNDVELTLFVGRNGTIVSNDNIGLSFGAGSLVQLGDHSRLGLMVFFVKVHYHDFGTYQFANSEVSVKIASDEIRFSTYFNVNQIVRYGAFAFDDGGYTYYDLVRK